MAPPPFPFPSPKLSGALAIAFTSGTAASAQAAPPADAPAPQRPSSAPPVLPEPASEPAPAPAPEAPVDAPGALPDPAVAPALPAPAASPSPSPTAAPVVAPPAAAPAAASDPNFAELFDESDLPPEAGSEAAAGTPSTGLLRPTDKRKFFTLSLGTQASLLGAYSYSYYGYGGSSMPLRIEGSVGAHFKRNALWGASFVMSDTLGTPFQSLQLGARVQRDRPFSERYGIYSQTAMTLSMRVNLLSYGLVPVPYGFGGAFEVSWGAKFIMAERLALTFRPVNVELAGDTATIFNLNWNIMVGVGTVW